MQELPLRMKKTKKLREYKCGVAAPMAKWSIIREVSGAASSIRISRNSKGGLIIPIATEHENETSGAVQG